MREETAWHSPEEGEVGRLGTLQAMWMSFWPGRVYQRVATEWTGYGLRYLAILGALTWTVWLVVLWVPILLALPEVDASLEGFPDVRVEGGVVHSSAAQPLEWELDGEVFLFDLEGTATDEQLARAKVIVRQTSLGIQRNEWEHREYDLSGVEELELDAEVVAGWVKTISVAGVPVIVASLGLCWFLWRALLGLAYGALAVATGAPDHQTGVRLGIVATTPVTWIGTLWVVLGWRPPMWMFLSWLLLLSYVAIAGRLARSAS